MDRIPQGDPNLPRHGGAGFKRNGFLGQIQVPGTNDYATEYSIGDERGEMPTMVPTLDSPELRQLLQSIGTGGAIPQPIIDKATQHAAIRRATGLSPFAGDNESPVPTRPPGPYSDELVRPNPEAGMLNMLLSSFRR
jgi:hypothetical protein